MAKLNMNKCSIQREGAVAFASMLKKNQCLKTLHLSDDSVGVEGALELIESLKHNTTLEKLWLSEECKPPSFSTLDKTLQDRVTFTVFIDYSTLDKTLQDHIKLIRSLHTDSFVH